MHPYDFQTTEEKWQKFREENHSFRAVDFSDKPKYYILSE